MQQSRYGINTLIFLMQLLAISSTLLIAVMYFFEYNKAKQRYFTVDPAAGNKSLAKEIFPLNEPNVSTATLLRWASLAATSAYTLDFVNYEDSLENLKQFFTKTGFKDFMLALEGSSRLNDIISKKLIVSAVVSGQPLLCAEGELNGVYSWDIQIPLLISYQGASEKSTKQSIIVSIMITRVPTYEASVGIGINQLKDGNFNTLG